MLFHWKHFTITDQSVKTAKVLHCERFAIYGVLILNTPHFNPLKINLPITDHSTIERDVIT